MREIILETDLGAVGLEIQTIGYEQAMDNLDQLLAKSNAVRRAITGGPRGAAAGGGGTGTAQKSLMSLKAAGQAVSTDLGDILGNSFDQFISRGADAKALLQSLEKEALAYGSAQLTGKRSTTSGDLFSNLFSGAGDFLTSAFAGFASGGQFRVGGAAGRDRNLVGLRLSRGEQVTVQTPGQQRAGQSETTPSNFTFNYQISTPDVEGFRRSQSQLQSEALKSAQRSLKRNG